MSQTALAKKSKVTQPHISYIVNNKKVPSAQVIAQIAESFGVPVQRLFDLALIHKTVEKYKGVNDILYCHNNQH